MGRARAGRPAMLWSGRCQAGNLEVKAVAMRQLRCFDTSASSSHNRRCVVGAATSAQSRAAKTSSPADGSTAAIDQCIRRSLAAPLERSATTASLLPAGISLSMFGRSASSKIVAVGMQSPAGDSGSVSTNPKPSSPNFNAQSDGSSLTSQPPSLNSCRSIATAPSSKVTRKPTAWRSTLATLLALLFKELVPNFGNNKWSSDVRKLLCG
mmetsp:Transcript_14058/g.28607  ORF Transcript_14058/g.28607 Transcript_14058/m.28607 type:complete len:210 (-) Transcript_14058:106-735(-)